MVTTPAEIEAAAKVIACSEYWLEPSPQEPLETAWNCYCEEDKQKFRKIAQTVLAAAEAVREEPKGCPVPGACQCAPPKERRLEQGE